MEDVPGAEMGDRTALDAVVEPTIGSVLEAAYPALRRFAAVVADKDLDPDDVLHDAILIALRSSRDRVLHAPEIYVRRAILGVVVAHRRTSARRRRIWQRTPERQSDQTDDGGYGMIDTLAALDPRDRAILYAVDVENASLKEYAFMIGSTHAAVRAHIIRARRRAARSMGTQIVESTGGTNP